MIEADPPTAADRRRAAEALREARRAEAAVRRHSVNSGVIPLLWGLLILVTLPLFDLVPPLAAGIVLAAGSVLASLATMWLARRSGAVRPSRRAVAEYTRLIGGWGVYYAVLILAWGIWLHFPRSALLVAPLAAAPLIVGGTVMWLRGRS